MSSTFRVLVCGGRDYDDRERVYKVLGRMVQAVRENDESRPIVIVHGAATGADNLAADFVKSHRGSHTLFGNISERAYPADWKTHGRAAGPIRNRLMLTSESPHVIIAFKGGNGTADMIQQGKKAGVPVYEVK